VKTQARQYTKEFTVKAFDPDHACDYVWQKVANDFRDSTKITMIRELTPAESYYEDNELPNQKCDGNGEFDDDTPDLWEDGSMY
jgi:hypothetical protein